jgi:hypothetical protein
MTYYCGRRKFWPNDQVSDASDAFATAHGSAQRTRDIENLRVTIKILERQGREIELESARFFLRKMKKPSTTSTERSG